MGLYDDRTCRHKKKQLTQWRDVLQYALGEVGLLPDEFWSMTWGEVETACRGYEIRMARLRELDRFIASILYNANKKEGARGLSPEDIMPLITDRKAKKVELISIEEFERAKELFSKIKWQIQN